MRFLFIEFLMPSAFVAGALQMFTLIFAFFFFDLFRVQNSSLGRFCPPVLKLPTSLGVDDFFAVSDALIFGIFGLAYLSLR